MTEATDDVLGPLMVKVEEYADCALRNGLADSETHVAHAAVIETARLLVEWQRLEAVIGWCSCNSHKDAAAEAREQYMKSGDA